MMVINDINELFISIDNGKSVWYYVWSDGGKISTSFQAYIDLYMDRVL